MTNEEAIELLNELMDNEAYLEEYSGASNEPMNIALELAIEVLKMN